MEENRKRQAEHAPTGDPTGKRLRNPSNADKEDDNDDDMMAWLNVDDETATELSNLLDTTEATNSEVPPPFKVKFTGDPYSSSLVFQSSSYVTINGNEEACGSSFSDLDSSVMASIDMGGVKGGWFLAEDESGGGAFGRDADESRGWIKEINEKDEEEGSLVKNIVGDGGGELSDEYGYDDLLVKFLGGEDLC